MAEFNPNLVTVYDVISNVLHTEDLVHINAVVVKTKNPVLDGVKTFNNKLAVMEHEDNDLTDTTYKLFFTDKTFFYIDLGINEALYSFKEGPLDLLTGQKLTHFQFDSSKATFRMPMKNFGGLSTPQNMLLLKYFLQGINIDKIDRLKDVSGVNTNEINTIFNSGILDQIQAVDTPSGGKINFVNDGGIFKEFVRIAHED